LNSSGILNRLVLEVALDAFGLPLHAAQVPCRSLDFNFKSTHSTDTACRTSCTAVRTSSLVWKRTSIQFDDEALVG